MQKNSGTSRLTEKQKRFADEYLIDLNATRAYLSAYPSVKREETARANGSRLLTYANVKAYIEESLAEIHDAKIADATEVLQYLTSVMRGTSVASVLSMCGDGCQEVIEKAPDEKERLKAAELIGKRYSLFTDKVDLTHTGVVILDNVPGDADG